LNTKHHKKQSMLPEVLDVRKENEEVIEEM
jgi:hypothetical protein